MTIKESLIESHYENLEEELTWTKQRFLRLCASLQLTPGELARYLRCRPSDAEKWMRVGAFPGPVELHLTLIARAVWPNNGEPIFPCLST
jgi:hypothetical protein